jgi:hypothetical protein
LRDPHRIGAGAIEYCGRHRAFDKDPVGKA